METLFEFCQRDSSWGDNVELVEIKIFENGELFYNIDIEGRYMTYETKPENRDFAECIKGLVERQLRYLEDIPDELENNTGLIKRQYIKIGSRKISGHDLKRTFDYTGLSEELQNEDQLVQVIGTFKKFIEKFYPDYIAWSEVGDNWFEEAPKFSNYQFEDHCYTVSGDEVYLFDEEKLENVLVSNITASQLEMYGECVDAPAIELKIKAIKEFASPDWKALITADDGAGVEIAFWDETYFDHPEIYKVGEVGLYNLWANIEDKPTPEVSEDGVVFTDKEAEKYEEFLWDDEADVKTSTFSDFAFFEKTDDFDISGKYKFRTVVSRVMYASDENEQPLDDEYFGFDMSLMNQIYKENPRRIMAQFNLDKPFKGNLEGGMGLSGILYLSGTKAVSQNVCKYGDNADLTYDEKYPDTSEWDDESGEDED